MIAIDKVVKLLKESPDFALNRERAHEFVGCPIYASCPHANEPVDRLVWYHFVEEGGMKSGMKLCPACSKTAIEHPAYPEVVCRTPKVIVSIEDAKDIIRMGRGEAISEFGKKLEAEVLEEATKKGEVN
jgi:hypothetical protein